MEIARLFPKEKTNIDASTERMYSLLLIAANGAEIIKAYCNSRSIFAHSTREYYPEVVSAGENGTRECEEGRDYFHLDIYYRNLGILKTCTVSKCHVIKYLDMNNYI